MLYYITSANIKSFSIIYLLAPQSIMGTHVINLIESIVILIRSLSILPIIEFGKWFVGRKYYNNPNEEV